MSPRFQIFYELSPALCLPFPSPPPFLNRKGYSSYPMPSLTWHFGQELVSVTHISSVSIIHISSDQEEWDSGAVLMTHTHRALSYMDLILIVRFWTSSLNPILKQNEILEVLEGG